MRITRHLVAQKVADYLRHKISLEVLVNWAESAIMEDEFDEEENLRDAVARLGLADVRSFGLTWEDCEQLLQRLGYTAHVDIAAV